MYYPFFDQRWFGKEARLTKTLQNNPSGDDGGNRFVDVQNGSQKI